MSLQLLRNHDDKAVKDGKDDMTSGGHGAGISKEHPAFHSCSAGCSTVVCRHCAGTVQADLQSISRVLPWPQLLSVTTRLLGCLRAHRFRR